MTRNGRPTATTPEDARVVVPLLEASDALKGMAKHRSVLPPYPEYKPSNVSWMAPLPSHWTTTRLKFIAGINPEALTERCDPDWVLKYIDIGNVDYIRGVLAVEELQFSDAPTRARRRVRDGDVLLSTVRTYLKAVALVEAAPDNLIASTGFAVLRPGPTIHAEYLYRAIQSQEFIETVVAVSVGVTYPAIAPSVLGGFRLWLPPLDEQRAIAAFLRRETAKIDLLVAGLSAGVGGDGLMARQARLLHEYRVALITAAVTGRVDVTKEASRGEG